MNALKSPQPFLQVVEPASLKPRPVQRKQRRPHQVLAIETTAKLVLNGVFIVAGFSAMVRILPYQLSQQQRLQEIRSEVKLAEARVDRLRTDFSRSFDPQQTGSIMQSQGHRVDPSQRQIIWLDSQPPASKPLPPGF